MTFGVGDGDGSGVTTTVGRVTRSGGGSIQFSILDAPAHDEIVVALGGSIGGRPHHRIGDRYQDLEELGGTVA